LDLNKNEKGLYQSPFLKGDVMQVKVIKNTSNGKYYASLYDFNPDLFEKYYVEKSWVVEETQYNDFNFDLHNAENGFDFSDEEYNFNLYSPLIELEELTKVTHFYTIMLINKKGYEFPIHIDFRTFHNIKFNEEIYICSFPIGTFEDEEIKRYKIILVNNYNDEFPVFVYKINKNIVYLRLSDSLNITGKSFTLNVLENNVLKIRQPFRFYVEEKCEFAIERKTLGAYTHYKFSPVLKYAQLKSVSVTLEKGGTVTANRDSYYIKPFELYVPNRGIYASEIAKFNYTLEKSLLIPSEIEVSHEVSVRNETYEDFSMQVTSKEYDFANDSVRIDWECSHKNITFEVLVGNVKKYTTRETSLVIENLKQFHNNTSQIFYSIKAGIETAFNSDGNTVSLSDSFSNHHFIDESSDFKPSIDYSDCISVNKDTGYLQWSRPKWYSTFEVQVRVKNIAPFVDEYVKPWETDLVLDDTIENFDTEYDDYDESFSIMYDDYFKTINSGVISYDSTESNFISVGASNFINLPLWFTNKDEMQYEITVRVLDRWNNVRGTSTATFSTQDKAPIEFLNEDIQIYRNQFLQFGESGTVGTFFTTEQPTPVDARASFLPTLKTFLNSALYDYTNIDSDGNSLYYYFSANKTASAYTSDIIIKYRRTSNFYNFLYKVEKDDETLLDWSEHRPKGNEFKDNSIVIPRALFSEEGVYKLKIQTYNATGQNSNVKELKFFVHNTRPDTPVILINNGDYTEEDGAKSIRKKFFTMNVVNNSVSDKYAGWKFKEVHFYFRLEENLFKDYPDYVAQSSLEDGDIVMRNTVAIENGVYQCKVIGYDYSGNASASLLIDFELNAKIKISPEVLFVNELDTEFEWTITKPDNCEGFYYSTSYSSDGINFTDDYPTKVPSPYYVDQSDTSQEHILTRTLNKGEGFYKLKVYEYNTLHVDGLANYTYTSEVVQVNVNSDPSLPVYCMNNGTDFATVFNSKASDEWTYTSDMDKLVFETIHSISTFDDIETTDYTEGQYYKLQLIEPHSNGETPNMYECTLPLPTEVGFYQFTNIISQCGITGTPVEGVWEMRFITVDKFNNNNFNGGYFTYKINFVDRVPEITSIQIASQNSANYFGLNSTDISYWISCDDTYKDIINYQDYPDMFAISKYYVTIPSSPFGVFSEYSVYKNSVNAIEILNKLTPAEKISHSRDGKYTIQLCVADPLKRRSLTTEKYFIIDTILDSELFFISGYNHYNISPTLVASIKGEVNKVYYKVASSIPTLSEETLSSWSTITPKEITLTDSTSFTGLEFDDFNFDEDGIKQLYYVIEETSGNISSVKSFEFRIISNSKLMPIFDLTNKIFYSFDDTEFKTSWNSTMDELDSFRVKFDKIVVDSAGEITVVESYAPSVINSDQWVKVGAENSEFYSVGSAREIQMSIPETNSLFITGYYRITVEGTSIFGDIAENSFFFQLDKEELFSMADNIQNNRITIDSNVVSWSPISQASYYEVSYTGAKWQKVTDIKFIVDVNQIMPNANGIDGISMRWRNRNGVISPVCFIPLTMSLQAVEAPTVAYYDNGAATTENNSMMKWKVTFEDLSKIDGIYYSFDKVVWTYKQITKVETLIVDNTIDYPIENGYYQVYVYAVDSSPAENTYYNKSSLSYAKVRVNSGAPAKVTFADIISGSVKNEPIKLQMQNKEADVQYSIYVNDRKVEEGYEIASTQMSRFNIVVKCKKYGLDTIYTLISQEEDLHFWSFVNQNYTIELLNTKIICEIDSVSSEFIISSFPNKRQTEVILFKEKGISNATWSVLRIGDRLNLLKEWEFHISTFSVL
jgi:hypothetical protein